MCPLLYTAHSLILSYPISCQRDYMILTPPEFILLYKSTSQPTRCHPEAQAKRFPSVYDQAG